MSQEERGREKGAGEKSAEVWILCKIVESPPCCALCWVSHGWVPAVSHPPPPFLVILLYFTLLSPLMGTKEEQVRDLKLEQAEWLIHRVHTQTGKGYFLAYIHREGKISPAWWGWRVHATPPFTLSTMTSKVVVYHPAERAGTLPLFLHYPYMHSVGQGTVSERP